MLARIRDIHLPLISVCPINAVNRVEMAAPSQQVPTNPAELEAFLDDLMAEHMEELHIAGAAISIVKDGELFFTKGHGYADVENGTSVDPEQTVFKLALNSKLFT